ncbi:hypothetical protein FF124_01060 [Martelella lutilitoris]|uniref:Winged helix-turn-helix transcriptional regulator n=1 Tax=Martelella lutilitoris TaxID=2583532 RepID=A0A5C4JWH3_9HYPH|nr:hypothetical protein [Martelella lutilitoris]TNB49580.1 hypothetical protein FF124_01060 [Martelella lutilitoris]
MRELNAKVHFLPKRKEPDPRLVSHACALAALARTECLQIARALEAGGLSRLDVCRMTGLSIIEVAAAMASLLAHGLILAPRQGSETVYELAHPRLGEVILLAEELSGARPRHSAC